MKVLLSKKFNFKPLNPDVIGMVSSMACLLHCLFLPLLLILQPVIFSFVGDLQENSWWEYLDYIFLVLGALAVYFATQKQKNNRKILFYIAYIIFALGIFFEENLSFLSYIGSFGLVFLHIKNYLEHKNCPR